MQHISNLPHGTVGCPACALNILISSNESLNNITVFEIISYILIAIGVILVVSALIYFFIKKAKNNKKNCSKLNY